MVYPDRMLANFELSHGLVFSQPVLLAFVKGALTRDDAYRLVQRDAMAAWETPSRSGSVLEEDPEVSALWTQGASSTRRSTWRRCAAPTRAGAPSMPSSDRRIA